MRMDHFVVGRSLLERSLLQKSQRLEFSHFEFAILLQKALMKRTVKLLKCSSTAPGFEELQ
jgi:hypothetical protein